MAVASKTLTALKYILLCLCQAKGSSERVLRQDVRHTA